MTRRLAAVLAGALLPLGAPLASAQEPQVNANNAVTLIGCVEFEPDYRARLGQVGVWEPEAIVLSGAHPEAEPSVRVDYSLTGKLEPQLVPHAGTFVQIAGFVEDETTHQPPSGPELLPRLFITVWQAIGQGCPAS